jgi:cytochrome c biogenesis protein CcdA
MQRETTTAMTFVQSTGYHAGACNIGPQEIAARRRAGHVGLAFTLGLLAVLVLIGAPPIWRLAIAVPAAGTAVTYLQAILRFCVAFGWMGVFNFGTVGTTTSVQDDEARRADRARALRMIAGGSAIGLAVGILAVLL